MSHSLQWFVLEVELVAGEADAGDLLHLTHQTRHGVALQRVMMGEKKAQPN